MLDWVREADYFSYLEQEEQNKIRSLADGHDIVGTL